MKRYFCNFLTEKGLCRCYTPVCDIKISYLLGNIWFPIFQKLNTSFSYYLFSIWLLIYYIQFVPLAENTHYVQHAQE